MIFAAQKLNIILLYYRRWIRLLFGREFPLNKVLVLWDGIFAEDPTLRIVDFICVTMMLLIRDECEYYRFFFI